MDYTTTYDPAAAAAATAAAGTLVIGWIIFWLVFGGLGLVLFLWALIDCIRRDFPNSNDKVLWLVLIILIGWLGPILYLIIGRKKGTIRQ